MSLSIEELVQIVAARAEHQRARLLSTYRFQLTSDFTLANAAAAVSYLRELGISHAYASPYLTARPGSTHGYDVCDHSQIDPQLGGAEGHAAFVSALEAVGLGHIVDVVPNHMAASAFNPWWCDVLENGPSSPYSGYFDIDWRPIKEELDGKVLLPVLGKQYGEALESGELSVTHADGAFFVHYFSHRFPLEPKTTLQILNHDVERLRQVLGKDAEECLEFESIVTALEHLPGTADGSAEVKNTRRREKEVIKRRLRDLESRSSAVAEFVSGNVQRFEGQPGETASFDPLDQLLGAQPYRLCHWRSASDEINYRRFFDVNELAALSMESPEVFHQAHALIGRLLARGEVAGLRIDHIDGLLAPEQYLWRLQWLYWSELARLAYFENGTESKDPSTAQAEWPARARAVLEILSRQAGFPQPTEADFAAVLGEQVLTLVPAADSNIATANNESGQLTPQAPPLYVVVEKILGPEEPIPDNWATAGTTGYDYLKALGGLFIDDAGWIEVQRIYSRFLDGSIDFEEEAYEGKQLVLRFAMASELQMMAHRLNRISEQHRRSRDFTLNMLRHALREILASFPVYRTYVGPLGISDRDRQFVQLAIARARRRNPAVDSAIFDFIMQVLLLEHPEGLPPEAVAERAAFAGRFQQVTSPVMAKGVEDTAFYVCCPLLSANEVGGDPRRPTCSVADFHRENAERQLKLPRTLLATSTHDTKRSEDVRARISVLAEMPGKWRKAVNAFARHNRRHIQEVEGLPAPSKNDEYVFYQTLVGAWPISPPDPAELEDLTARMQACMEKASHEAKQRTSWINPSAAYDQALRAFVAAALKPGKKNRFLAALAGFHAGVIDDGLYSALCQTVLKLTSPGVPDIYQGQELWDFSLVDPDNRRPVDYAARRWLLGEIQAAASDDAGRAELVKQLAISPRDSRTKLWITWRLLSLRRERPGLFSASEYLPLEVRGAHHKHLVAFARQYVDPAGEQSTLLVIVPRLLAQLLANVSWLPEQARAPLGEHVWLDTEVTLPAGVSGQFHNALTGETHELSGGTLRVGDALQGFPAAVLVNVPRGTDEVMGFGR